MTPAGDGPADRWEIERMAAVDEGHRRPVTRERVTATVELLDTDGRRMG